jgi:Uma2 family endonuclease
VTWTVRQCYRNVMGTTTLIPVEEYLDSSYSPDVEYVDGVLIERNVGTKLHSRLQRNLAQVMGRKYPNLFVWPEWRMRTLGDHYRIPDVCITLTDPPTEVLEEPPLVAIEILSPKDRLSRVLEKLKEYAAFGIPNIWLFDPELPAMFVFRGNALIEIEGDVITTIDGAIELTREEIFRQ